MNLGLNNKKALVTGAGRGLGKAIAMSLAAEGVKIAAVSRTMKDLKKLLIIMGENKGHFVYPLDLAKTGAPEKLEKELGKGFGSPDIIVNNLGGTLEISDPFCPISDWRKIWRINMEVAVEINNLFIPSMRKKKWGRIVNITSIAALENQGPVPYCAVKAALTSYSRSMGRILAPSGIIMTSVLPGAVWTRGGYWDKASRTRAEHVRKYLQERMAIKRFGRPEEISSVVTFLCSEMASFCVGSTVPVDGGQGRVFF